MLASHASSRSDGRTHTALNRWQHFRQAVPHRVPFLELTGGAGDINAKRYNAATLGMFKGHCHRVGDLTKRGGGPIATGTVDGYASAIRILRSIECGYDILGDAKFDNLVLGRASKAQRLISTAPVQRKASLGVRACDIAAAFPRLHTDSAQGVVEHAARLFAHNIVGRGADPGVIRSTDKPNPGRDLMWTHFDWETGRRSSPPVLYVHMVPSKDTGAMLPRRPIPISRRSTNAPFLSDPLDAYDWIARAWMLREAQVHQRDRATTLFFTHPDGRPFCSEDVARIGRDTAKAAGWAPERVKLVGAKWARIGGATDFRDQLGPVAGRELLRARGRWATDLDEIYARVTVDELAAASAKVGDARAPDLERLFPGWVQPGR